MAGLQASLRELPSLEVKYVQGCPETLRECLKEHAPDVLIMELGVLERESILSLLTDFPHLTLVGLDPESERILMLSLQQDRKSVV